MLVTMSNIPQIIIAIQCLTYLIFFLIWKGLIQKTNRYPLIFFLLLCFQMLGFIFSQNGFYPEVLQRINMLYGFVYAPLFYCYIKELLYEKKYLNRNWIHRIPLTISLFFIISNVPVNFLFVYFLYFFITIGYFITGGKLIADFINITQQTRSVNDIQKLNYLRWLFGIYLLVLLSDIIQFLSENTGFSSYVKPFFSVLVFVFVFLLVNVMFYFSVFHAQFLYAVTEEEETLLPGTPVILAEQLTVSNTPEKTKEPDQDTILLLKELQEYIQKEKSYLHATLTLKDIANALNVPPRTLSQMINDNLQTNFSNYINTLRVEEAAARLKSSSDKKETVAEIMYTCGFNTKSAFFTAFKKRFNMTPKQYKDLGKK